ncbi:winged helix-turn-helix transcriptional regulator [Thermogymnomonas acidicola]|uniref:Lrp/AsnC family transcriptional regulator n=1 Tax=Thermogymnomonas acidicola TaxID=399579 RepID=UPI000946187F|nr:winged helix-turn-helix transcriptional regulator [Thermogymnomonas acidicola]
MDRIDKGILSQLLRDGRTTQRQMAENLGISAQALNYRLNRLMSEGVVRGGFKLHVTPKFYGGEGEFFAAFNGDISRMGRSPSTSGAWKRPQ